MTDSIKKNENQCNDAIENETKFDNTFILYIRTKDPLLVVTVSLRVGKKKISMMVDGLTCLWNSGATESMIKIKHTKYYGRKKRSNKLEYSTAAGLCCKTHDNKVPFFMPELSSSRIIEHHFHVDNKKS